MIELRDNELVFRFPNVHEDAEFCLDFQKTLRIPDDSRAYSLPPGLGNFPIEHVEDHAERVNPTWLDHGGVMIPMYQSEALWLSFSSGVFYSNEDGYPFAVKIAAGKINAVTGDAWTNTLQAHPQDYIVVPDQPWLDGFCVQNGLVRQFVAMPLGEGFTAEEQITGAGEHGGLQIIAYPMKREHYEEILRERAERGKYEIYYSKMTIECSKSSDMGLASGGLMKQEIYKDKHGADAWDVENSSRCFVHILNSEQWTKATGKPVPGKAPSAKVYAKAGLPWFEYYNDKLAKLEGSKVLAGMDSVAAKMVKLGKKILKENEPVNAEKITK